MDKVIVFAPGTVANVACGFDVLGFALNAPGDTITLRKVDAPGIHILPSTDGYNLPTDPAKNTAGIALQAMLDAHPVDFGLEVLVEKGIQPGSGMGSSASSAAGAVVALNALMGNPLSRRALVAFAMEGERGATGAPHADNVAPALMGGFTLVRSYQPLEVLSLPTPSALHAVVLHPQIEVKTEQSRAMLRQDIPMKKAITQWGNLGGLVSALYEQDYRLLGRCLVDVVVEPTRALLIPLYGEMKAAAIAAGALGMSISGSGPSMFALTEGHTNAQYVRNAMAGVYDAVGIPFDIHVSEVNAEGCKVQE
ncbi:MAG TPA: homoserine kinase [Cytophagales bacterium]|nr:homoserine kinase [Cytophagales bacterium]HAP64465.1 homoserine kinase [Cytophagales bacterium]